MKQWKLVLVALLAVLLVCTCTSALAADCAHTNAVEVKGDVEWEIKDASQHRKVQWMDSYCPDCKTVVETKVSKTETLSDHVKSQVSTKAATCTEEGSYYETCAVCSWKSQAYGTAKKDHEWNITAVAATCKKDAYNQYTCKNCGESHEWDVQAGTKAHKYTYVSVAATCTTAKHNHYTCTACGYEADFDFQGDALGHAWASDIVVKPTCTDKGYTYSVCSRCDAESGKRNYVDAGHTWGKDIVVKPTCTAKGYTHKVCEVCGADSGKFAETGMTDHSPVKTFPIVPTCTTKGEYVIACQFCGKEFDRKVVGVAAHNYELVKAKTAYCGEDGHPAYYKCSACGALRNEGGIDITKAPVTKMPAPAHDWYAGEKKEATCLEGGYVKYLCHFCTKINKVETEKLAHEYNPNGWKTIKAATCFETGLKTNSCILCGGAEKEESIPVAGHKFATGEELKYNGAGDIAGGKGKVTKAATCTTEGAATVICQTCNKTTKNIVIPAHGHVWGNWDYSAQPNCTTAMTGWRTCKSCGTKETIVVAEKLGHAWIVKAGTDATCTTDGKVDRFCPLCNTTEKNVKVPATGHNLIWTTVAQPSAAADGLKELACTVCGFVADSEVIPYTVMRYSNTATAFGPCTRDLVGGSEWARVTPIDLSVEGTFTYPLIASNQYVIGTVTVTIANGTATVNYDTAAAQIKVTSEALLIYADKAALAAGTAQEYAFGAPIQIGEDTKVILSVLLTVDYDAVGAGVTGFAADEAQIEAMKAIMD